MANKQVFLDVDAFHDAVIENLSENKKPPDPADFLYILGKKYNCGKCKTQETENCKKCLWPEKYENINGYN